MSLILCRQEPVKHPFYFDGLGVHLYSSQELCYIIYKNPMLVLEGFVDDHLIAFIRDELDMGFLAAKLEKWKASGEDEDGLLMLILQECDYLSAAEMNRVKLQIESCRKMTPAEFGKAKADYLFAGRQFGKAKAEYEKLLEMRGDPEMDDAFLARLYNNLGASYARLFLTEKAYAAYLKSFDLEKSSEVLKRIYYLSKWNPNLILKDRLLALITDDVKKVCEEELEKAWDHAAGAESVLDLEELFLKDPIKRLAGAGEMVQNWKREYRNMI